ncbi:hypothetical protein D9757_010138 [Collybiopsis confluens]|uniref:NAD(P)-binding protein n=1 Tax=Collybiopsis confluens TaxID=2823264 RepID=A0A8H5GSP9_9AGAR|nr:hypothetical protein D9757_010138 [Collybiopsis confluens]
MPSISHIRAANAAALSATNYLPVGIFVGGTSGIGEGMAEVFAKHTSGNAHIILIGRNRAQAENIISRFPKPTQPLAKHEFLSCDVTLMRNVRSVSEEIRSRVQKVNFLMMSPGYMTTSGRNETEEGIDRKLAVHYYARWTFIKELAPLLDKAKVEGEDAKVLSVLGAGVGRSIDVDDLGLKKIYSVANAAAAAPTYNDLMLEGFAARHPTVTFAHANPGPVNTNILSSAEMSSVTKTLISVAMSALSFFITSKEDCGEYMFNGVLNTAKTPGVAWRISSQGEDLAKKRYYGTESERKRLWEHSIEATGSKE